MIDTTYNDFKENQKHKKSSVNPENTKNCERFYYILSYDNRNVNNKDSKNLKLTQLLEALVKDKAYDIDKKCQTTITFCSWKNEFNSDNLIKLLKKFKTDYVYAKLEINKECEPDAILHYDNDSEEQSLKTIVKELRIEYNIKDNPWNN